MGGGRFNLFEDFLDVLFEAHIKHLVSFVEHDSSNRLEFQITSLDLV